MDVENVGVGANHLLKEVVAVLNGYLPRQSPTQLDGCDLYIAEEWQTKQPVVVKIGTRKQQNIRGDLFYWGMLSCAHIMELTDCFYYDSYVYFVSPFYSHGSLHDILTGPDPTIKHKVNELLVRKWAKQLLIFLNRLHTMGLFHLNVRKKALFVDNLTNLRIGGLGYVTLYNDRYALFGRMDHIPPEILEHYPHSMGHDLSKVDVWSVGGLICELLSGFSISGPVSGDTLADRLNRRLIIRQNLDSLMTLPALTAVSRGGRGFLSWLLKWEANARPTARQALKHPWLRDQEIRLELYQLDRLLGKMEGRPKLIPQLSLVHPMVPLIPHQGIAVVRPRLLAKSEISNRQFKLGLTEERLHLSKHAWSFREHVLTVDEARREMWTALYDLLAASDSRWQWTPIEIPPGRQYKLPIKRSAFPPDAMETGEPAYIMREGTSMVLPIDVDDQSPYSFQLLGGSYENRRIALRGGAEKRRKSKEGISPSQIAMIDEDDDEVNIQLNIQCVGPEEEDEESYAESEEELAGIDDEEAKDEESSDESRTTVSNDKDDDDASKIRVAICNSPIDGNLPGPSGYRSNHSNSSDSSTRSYRRKRRKRRSSNNLSALKAKRRRLSDENCDDGESSSDTGESPNEERSDDSLRLMISQQTCPHYSNLLSLCRPSTSTTCLSTCNGVTKSCSSRQSSESLDNDRISRTSSDSVIISSRPIYSSVELRSNRPRTRPARHSVSAALLAKRSGSSADTDSVESREFLLAPFITPRSKANDDHTLNLLLDPLKQAETNRELKSIKSKNNTTIEGKPAPVVLKMSTPNKFDLSLPATFMMIDKSGKQNSVTLSCSSYDEPGTSFSSNNFYQRSNSLQTESSETGASDVQTFPFEVARKSRKRTREKSPSGSSSPDNQ
uniref:Protein kinase domain-containing protein n=1 Tax=Strigamia maritima TaxID=126957 RepID=T1ISE9_STRMM